MASSNPNNKEDQKQEEDEEPIIIQTSNISDADQISLTLVGRVWTERSVNAFGLMDTMKQIWNPAKGVTCREIQTNLFSFQFNSSRDVERVKAGQPWHFNKDVLVLQPVQPKIQPSAMQFTSVPFWIRIYDLPMAGRSPEVIKNLGKRLGNFLEFDESSTSGLTRSIRIRVVVDIQKPLRRGLNIIMDGSTLWLPIKYERLPSFCYGCGKLGHMLKDCEDVITEDGQAEGRKRFDESIRASPMKNSKKLVSSGRTSKNIFQMSKTKSSSEKEDDQSDSENKTNQQLIPSEEVNGLLDSLQRVGVGNSLSETLTPKHLPNINPTASPTPTINAGNKPLPMVSHPSPHMNENTVPIKSLPS
ncbi:uncharacterized protein LOC131009698 [Salvia miltiorrhiza]|uniref:uncharacterized protein LOC131009698 n=1 Tax=Salvia miltiorrhiza TaxID=226208 RepID=UPI0025AB908C|nr:uncharacterized protein LOC131009698 [Salvia miltiorrhiza]